MSDLSEMMRDAMGDPRFASILSALKEKADAGEIDVASLASELTSKEQTASPAKPGMESHKKLLSALRPYLKDPKQEAIDSLLKIGEFSGVIEALSKKKE